jgi:enterobactin synthetase component D
MTPPFPVSHFGPPKWLFPPPVHSASAPIDAASRAETGEQASFYRHELLPMGPERRAEFLLGRRCARRAMVACAPELAATPVRMGENREPSWPDGIVGSIAHTRALAAAAVVRTRHARGLGLDIEERMDAATAREVRDAIATAREVALVEKELALDAPSAVTLVFSVKEAVYKCLFPLVRRYFDHREAEVVEADASARRCTVQIVVDLGADIVAGTRLDVRVASDARHVYAGTWIRRR